MTELLFGPGSVTQTQLIVFSIVAVVFILLIASNVVVCHLYRRALTENERQTKRAQKKKMSDVWIYHVQRQPPRPKSSESPEEQILRKLKASNDMLKQSMPVLEQEMGLEEIQAVDELDVTNELYLQDNLSDTSSSRPGHDQSLSSAVRSAIEDCDSVILSSVKLSDFENPSERSEDMEGWTRKHRGKSKRRKEHTTNQKFPVAEFHNEAFDFAETKAAVERVKDVEL